MQFETAALTLKKTDREDCDDDLGFCRRVERKNA